MKKLISISSTLALVVAGLLPSITPAAAQVVSDSLTQGVARIVTYSDTPFNEETRLLQGSAIFVDHNGCFYTNSHVVLDLETDELLPHVVVYTSEDRGKAPVQSFEAEMIFVDRAVDLAYGCPKGDSDVFSHFFTRKSQNSFSRHAFGEEVYSVGYPDSGTETITISSGQIVGFMDHPDLEEFIGFPGLDKTRLRVYKTDALAGPGVSGGALLDKNFELLGIPFAGTLVPGAFVFNLSEDTYLDFEKEIRKYFYREGLAPVACRLSLTTGYYMLEDKTEYYDIQCSLPRNNDMEAEIRRAHKAICGTQIPEFRVREGAKRSSELGSLDKWNQYTLKICAAESALSGISGDVKELQELAEKSKTSVAADFAYGKPRLTSLSEEQRLAKELKTEIDRNFPGFGVDAKDWSTLVNSYVYGSYPVDAIVKAVKFGGYTVHPSIPFESWQSSKDYQTHI